MSLVTMIVSVAGQPAQAAVPLSTTMIASTGTLLNELKTKSSASDPRYLEANVWHDSSPGCFRCAMGPAMLAAAHGNVSTGTNNARVSMYSLDVAIRNHQRTDGAYIPPGTGEGSPDIQTIFFGYELAQSYLMFGSSLDASHRDGWSRSLTRAGDFLIKNGNVNYYINGNINLALAAQLDMTARITGQSRFRVAADSAMNFAMNPPQARWPGFGLRYTIQPTRADGSDGRGYFAEKGAGAPGYDPSYTVMQANLAATWYLLTGDARAKRVTNLLFNQLFTRVRTSDWTIELGGGTRKTAASIRYGFYSAALPVLALRGGRGDLVGYVNPQVKAALYGWERTIKNPGTSASYDLGVELASTVYVVGKTPGW